MKATIIDIEKPSISSESAIDTLLSYHIGEEHLPTPSQNLLKEVILLILGVGGLNYVPVAYQNGGANQLISIINAVTTAVLGEIILYTSGKIYYDIKILPQYIDRDLVNIIQAPLKRNEFAQEVFVQGVFAGASAIPLATTLFDADLEIFAEYPWLFWGALFYIWLVNTAMHLVPIELTMRDEFYGFLPRLLASCWGSLFHYEPSAEQEKLIERDKVLAEINPILMNAKINFLNNLAYENAGNVQAIVQRYKGSPNELLTDMLSCYKKTPPLNPYIKTAARIAGGGVVAGACLGYAANPYIVFSRDFGFSPLYAALMVALPIYFFAILMIFFGDGMGVRILQDVSSLICYSDATKKRLPTVAKLYPFHFALCAAAILFMVAFAGAPGREMLHIAFDPIFPQWLMTMMAGVVDIGIGMLAIYAPLDFTKIMLSYYMQYGHAEPAKSVAIIKAKIEALLRDFNRINPDYAQALKERVMSNISSIEPTKLEEGAAQKSSQGCCSRFWLFGNNDDITEKLLANTETHDIQL